MSSSDKDCASCDVGECDVNNMLHNMSTVDADASVCANCGKEGNGINNVCNKCNMVKYCNAACKKKHRHKHKKDCEEHVRLAAEKRNDELRIAAELHDEELFKHPPTREDCPICFLLLPTLASGRIYKTCCGKEICSGCSYAPIYDNQGNKVDDDKQNECAFCRVVAPKSGKEAVKRLNKRMDAGDVQAIYLLGSYYRDGLYGLQQDRTKAKELFHRAGELGYTKAYANIGYAYNNGDGVEVDEKKSIYYFELAAIRGNVHAIHNLGVFEENRRNWIRALKHYMIAVRNGHANSLQEIQDLFSKGHATKDEYTKALQLYQAYLGEIKSPQRDQAAEANDQCRYY